MASFHFNFFKSSVPRLADHLIAGGHGAEALDCRLDTGELDCWREPLAVATVPAGTQRFFRADCCWLEFDTCADVAEGPVLCNEIYLTGRSEYPEVGVIGENCVPVYSRLGVPCAETPLSVAHGYTDGKDMVKATFFYQYINARGKVGQLSPASDAVLYTEGQPVVLSGWAAPDPSWGVTSVRLSVQVSGLETGREAGNTLDTTTMVIAEVPVGSVSYTFSSYFDTLYAAVEEDICRPPPADLKGICRVSSMNCYAGFVGRRVYFSENNNPDNWPHFIDIEDGIKAIIESNDIIYVATYGRPAVIRGDADCKTAGCRAVLTHPSAYPMVGRSMVALPGGAGFAVKDGFLIMAGNSQPSLITWSLYSANEWHMMPPDTVTPVYHQGYLYLFGQGRSAVMKMASDGKNGWEADAHSFLSDKVTFAMSGGDGELYLLKGITIYRWNASTTLRPHKWVSPEVVSGVVRDFRAAYVNMARGPETFSLRCDDRVIEDRPLNGAKDFVLPGWGAGNRWQLTLSGTGRVKLASVATSFKELQA
jgi:hypothetical protein